MSLKQINISNITPTVGMRFKSGAITWPQAGIQETFDDLIFAAYPSVLTASFPTALWGCNNTTVGPNYTIQAGCVTMPVFGSAFQKLRVPATTFVAAATAVCVLVTTYPNVSAAGDPVTFSDGSTHSVFQLTELHVVDGSGATPGYVCDYADLVFLNEGWITPTLINSWTGTFEYKVNNGRVETRGNLDSTGSTSPIFFNFPAAIRPVQLQGAAVENFTDLTVAYCNVGTGGNGSMVIGYIVAKLYIGINLNWEF